MLDKCSVIIDELVTIRKAKGLTQKGLAKAANLAQPAIARLESKAATPQLDTLLKVANALGCDITIVPNKNNNPLIVFVTDTNIH